MKTKPTKARRAVIYLRVSTDEQAESGLGLEAQEAACRKWCAANGYAVASVFTDDGYSGSTPADKRPGLTAALGALGRGSVLVAAKRDRIARGVGIAAIVEEVARRSGAQVITPDVPQTDDPFVNAMRGMMDVFAELERAMIAARTKAALAAKRARGEKTGGDVPFGFTVVEGGKLAHNMEEVAVLKQIHTLREAGVSIRGVAERLNKDGVTARGKRWHKTTVERILGRAS
ncbi:MAG: recombinase family protein [Rhodanobacteraceae bacterium]|nr:recombinase family protein [Rhodanobacteraceae bacterium]